MRDSTLGLTLVAALVSAGSVVAQPQPGAPAVTGDDGVATYRIHASEPAQQAQVAMSAALPSTEPARDAGSPPPVVAPSGPTAGAAPSPLSDQANVPPPFAYQDARPQAERKNRNFLTLWRFSCEFGVRELGDEFVDRVGKLRHDISLAYGDRLAGKTIVVDHYHLYLNQRAMEGQHSWATAVGGVLAIGIGAQAETDAPACDPDKMPAGWFDPSELTTPWSPFIAEIELHIDGQDILVHSVYSPPKNMPAPGVLTDFDIKSEADAVGAAVDKANLAVIAEMARLYYQPGASPPVPILVLRR